MVDLFGASGDVVESIIGYAERHNLSKEEIWTIICLAHKVLEDMLYPNEPQVALAGNEKAKATYDAIMVHGPALS